MEAASYHKHIAFFRKHRDLMARMAEKLADELIHPKPPGHVHVVVETAKALGITEDEIFLAPMLAEFRAKLDFKRSLLWEGTIAEFYAAGATEEQTGYWSADFYKALTTHYGLSREQAVYFSTHEEADLKEHDGVMGHGSFRRLVLKDTFGRRHGASAARLHFGILRFDRRRFAWRLFTAPLLMLPAGDKRETGEVAKNSQASATPRKVIGTSDAALGRSGQSFRTGDLRNGRGFARHALVQGPAQSHRLRPD